MATASQRERRRALRNPQRWPALIKTASPPEVAEVLAGRTRGVGRIYKYRDETMFLDNVAEAPLSADRGAMSATFVISTPRPDREEDVIVPEGVVFDDYRLNPVVMWDHGFTNLTLPIGNSCALDGSLAVTVTPGKSIEATCYFSQSLLEAAQVFELVSEGILRAASIHVDPLDAVVRAQGVDRPGLLVAKSNMIEWSICAIGCNPDAVRKALSHGKLAGKPIHESLVKSLSRQAAPSQVWSNGQTFSKSETSDTTPAMNLEALRKSDEEREKRRKALEDEEREAKRLRKDAYDGDEEVKQLRKELDDTKDKDDEEAKSKRKSAISRLKSLAKDAGLSEDDANIPEEPGETTTRSEELEKDEEDGEDGDRPHGSKVLGALHSALSDVSKELEEAKRPLDNKEVKDYVEGISNSLNGMRGEIKDFHDAQYPDGPDLEKEQATSEPDSPNNDPPEASGMVKFLARNNTNRLGVKGASKSLDRLCGRKDLPKSVKQELQGISKTLARISDEALAKSKAVQQEDTNTAALARLGDLESKVDKMVDALSNAIPANRR